jgi:hypothetical protein
VINNKGILVYKELVADISNHPDYNAALAAVNGLSDVPNTVLPSVEKLEQPSVIPLEQP